jgi:hypothetical protein
MTAIPPPQGLNEDDYESIEAAVTETVRGRWFLSEYARRNRMVEMRQLLDAMGRLESAVKPVPAMQGSDPSVRLLIQRIKEIAARLDAIASDMRGSGVEARFSEAVELQGRAVAGMMRGGPAGSLSAGKPARIEERPAEPLPEGAQPAGGVSATAIDARLAVLSELDARPLADKLRLFA